MEETILLATSWSSDSYNLSALSYMIFSSLSCYSVVETIEARHPTATCFLHFGQPWILIVASRSVTKQAASIKR